MKFLTSILYILFDGFEGFSGVILTICNFLDAKTCSLYIPLIYPFFLYSISSDIFQKVHWLWTSVLPESRKEKKVDVS